MTYPCRISIWHQARKLAFFGALLVAPAIVSGAALAQTGQRPSPLVIDNGPLPADVQQKIYGMPRTQDIAPQQVLGASYYNSDSEQQTIVGRKVGELRNELFDLQGKVATLSERLSAVETNSQSLAAEYYASIATISTQLQSGTTPGNPRLIKKLGIARADLENLSGTVSELNDVALEVSNVASLASFLLESARASYSISGAVEEDHVRLAQLEDSINNTLVVIDRLLNNVNDDITRTVAYLSSERDNVRTLALAITTGDLFGKSLSNRPFSNVQKASFAPDGSMMAPQGQMMQPQTFGGAKRPLVKIRFDRPDVSYEQPLYMAVNEAMQRYPTSRFELVAVHPSQGNAAQVAIQSTRARRNAEKVLRSLVQMGLDLDRIDLSYQPDGSVPSNEVHLYIH